MQFLRPTNVTVRGDARVTASGQVTDVNRREAPKPKSKDERRQIARDLMKRFPRTLDYLSR